MRKKNVCTMLLCAVLAVSISACGKEASQTTYPENVNQPTTGVIVDKELEALPTVTEVPTPTVTPTMTPTPVPTEVPIPIEKAEEESNSDLKIDEEYAGFEASEGFKFSSNGDGTCVLEDIGVCEDSILVIPAVSNKGDKVVEIAEHAFYNCEDIETIVFAGVTMELADRAFQMCQFEKLVITGCDLIVGENCFSYCEDVTEIYISGSNIEFEEYAFYQVGKDAKLTIKNTTGVIGDRAFQVAPLAEINIIDCEIEVGENAFSYCEDVITVNINNCSIELGEYAFYDCGDEMTVMIYESDVVMDDRAFQCCEAISLEINNSDVEMGSNTFSYCEELSAVVIVECNVFVGEYCFYSCPELISVSIDENITTEDVSIELDDRAFQMCEGLTTVVIGNGNIKIGDSAFSYCEELKVVTIGKKISKIGSDVFYSCHEELVIQYDGGTYNAKGIEDID